MDAAHKESNENKGNSAHARMSAPAYQGAVPQSYRRPTVNFVHSEQSHSTSGNAYRGTDNQTTRSDRKMYENWRESKSSNSSSVALPDTSQPPPNFANNNISQNNFNSNAIRAISQSEFIQELCWDVEENHGPLDGQMDSRVISPRIQGQVCSRKVNILVDSGRR